MNKYAVRRALKLAFQELTSSRVLVANQLVIDQKIESIIYKLAADSFEESIKDKKFKNPETGNMVMFKSLPAKEQAKIRSQQKGDVGGGGGADEGLKKFLGNAAERSKNIAKTVKEIIKPDFKNKIKEGLKSFVNADDFSAFSTAIKNKDKAAMKKALPGMAKGVGKVVGTIAATALLGIGAAKLAPMVTTAITTKFMAGKAALAGYANPDIAKQIGGLKAELAKNQSFVDTLQSTPESPAAYENMAKNLQLLDKAQKGIAGTSGEIAKLTKSMNDMPVKDLATKAMKVFSHDASEYVSKAGESIKAISSTAAKSVSDNLHQGVSESMKFIGDQSAKVEGAWKHLGEKATAVVGEAQGKATQMVGEAQLDISNMYKSVETNLGHLATEAKKMGGDAFAQLKAGANDVVKKMSEEAAELKQMAHDQSEKVYNYLSTEGAKAKGLVEGEYDSVKAKLSGYADKAQSAYNERYGEHFAYSAADTKKITSLQSALSAAEKAKDSADKITDIKSQLDAAHTAAKAAGHVTKVNSLMTDVYKGTVLAGLAKNVGSAALNAAKKTTQKKAAEDKEMDDFAGEIQKFVMEEMKKLNDSEYLKKLMKG
jgi:hypothetical protein